MNQGPIFADANILLEVILPDRPAIEAAQDYLGLNHVVISPLTAHLVVYFGLKANLTLPYLLGQIGQFEFTEFNTAAVNWAMQNCQGQDFEDALQVACAILAGCQKIITFDRQLARNYQQFIPIKVLS
jgi:predicted nucleic acid-binding protein